MKTTLSRKGGGARRSAVCPVKDADYQVNEACRKFAIQIEAEYINKAIAKDREEKLIHAAIVKMMEGSQTPGVSISADLLNNIYQYANLEKLR